MKNPGDQSDVESRLMEERVRKLDAEYGFHFSDEEIKLIARQTENLSASFSDCVSSILVVSCRF